jgi:hypothetical protein
MRTPIKKEGTGTQKPPPKTNRGRPKKDIDLAAVKQLAGMQCTDEEMAAVLGISHDTLNRRKQSDPAFVEAMQAGKAHGRSSIRRQQFATAMKGNVPMLIWLGKQYLGQREKFEEAAEQSNHPLPWVD